MARPGVGLVTSWYVCLASTVPFIILRLRSRWRRHQKLGVDDFVFIAAIVVVMGFNATIVYAWTQGLADREVGLPIPEAQTATIMKTALPSKLLYLSAAWVTKISVVFFYRIIAPPVSQVVVVCYIALGYLVVSWCTVFFHTLFGCNSLDKYWAGDISNECPSEFVLVNWSLLTSLNISTNLLVICLPISMVAKLDMRIRDRFAIGFMFVLGFIVVAASSLQAYYNKQNKMMLSYTASMAELSTSLLATSLLALSRTLLGKYAFQASSLPRRSHRLTLNNREPHFNEVKLLEAFKTEEGTMPRHSFTLTHPNCSGVAVSLHSRPRTSTASRDSLVLPGQYHIGFTLEEEAKKFEEEATRGFERITVCVEVDNMSRQSKSEMEVKTPGMESWFER